MPFGLKPDLGGGPNIDFNRIYTHAIKPGIEDADMFPVRAHEEKLGGIIHKAMFERLLICEFAVADSRGRPPLTAALRRGKPAYTPPRPAQAQPASCR